METTVPQTNCGCEFARDFAGEVPSSDIFAGLPFFLPATEEASAWLNEMDYIDAQTGDLDELAALASTAPSESARSWLEGLISCRRFQEVFSTQSAVSASH